MAEAWALLEIIDLTAGKAMAVTIANTAIVTNSSISVKPLWY